MKLPLIAATVATLGLVAVPAMACSGSASAGGHPLSLAAAQSRAAGTVVAQQSPAPNDEQGTKSSEDSSSSDDDNDN